MKTALKKILDTFGLELRKKIPDGFWNKDDRFNSLYKEIQHYTLVKIDRCYMIYQYARFASKSGGDIAELGVYKGGTARLLAEVFRASGKKLYLFDTFEGLPPTDIEEVKEGVGDFSDITLTEVKEYLSQYQNIDFKKGIFPATARGLENKSFCFVYLDADLYESTRDGLDFFYPRLSAGGVIVVDDYGSRHWPGIKKAVDEFCKNTGIMPIITTSVQCALIKI